MWTLVPEDLPELEVGVDHPVGEALAANTDTFKYTVTSQLVHHKMGIDDSRLLQLVGDDATHEVRLGGPQSRHQVVQLFLIIVQKNMLTSDQTLG